MEHTCKDSHEDDSAIAFFTDHLRNFGKDKPLFKSSKEYLNNFMSLLSIYSLSLKNCPRCLSLL